MEEEIIYRYINGKIRPIKVNKEQTTNQYMNEKIKNKNSIKSIEDSLNSLKKEIGLEYHKYNNFDFVESPKDGWELYIITGPNHWTSTYDKIYKEVENKINDFKMINKGMDGFLLYVKK